MNETRASMKVLIDTLATKCIISRKFYEAHPELKNHPHYKLQARPIQVANGHKITTKQTVKLNIMISGHYFEVIAYILDIMDTMDLVIGAKGLMEIEGEVNF